MAKINRLEEVFKEKSVSNRDIAEIVNKSEETVSRWKNNHRQPPLEDLEKISKFLKVDRRLLLHRSEFAKEKGDTNLK